jgi:hypothetical protein
MSGSVQRDKWIHSGCVVGDDGVTFYYVDDVDAFPPDIREVKYEVTRDFSWTKFLMMLMDRERKAGDKFVVQIDDVYYETCE